MKAVFNWWRIQQGARSPNEHPICRSAEKNNDISLSISTQLHVIHHLFILLLPFGPSPISIFDRQRRDGIFPSSDEATHSLSLKTQRGKSTT